MTSPNARQGVPFIPNLLSPGRPNGLGSIRVTVEPYATSRYDIRALEPYLRASMDGTSKARMFASALTSLSRSTNA